MSYERFKWVVKCALLHDALLSCVTTQNPSRRSQQVILRSQNEYESGGEFTFNANNQHGDGAGLSLAPLRHIGYSQERLDKEKEANTAKQMLLYEVIRLSMHTPGSLGQNINLGFIAECFWTAFWILSLLEKIILYFITQIY